MLEDSSNPSGITVLEPLQSLTTPMVGLLLLYNVSRTASTGAEKSEKGEGANARRKARRSRSTRFSLAVALPDLGPCEAALSLGAEARQRLGRKLLDERGQLVSCAQRNVIPYESF